VSDTLLYHVECSYYRVAHIGIIERTYTQRASTAYRYSYHWRLADTGRRTAAGQTSIKHLPQRNIIVIKPVVCRCTVRGRSTIVHTAVNNDKIKNPVGYITPL